MVKLSKKEVFTLLGISFSCIIITVLFSIVAFQLGTDSVPNSIKEIWTRWDAYHYIFIAQNWYPKPDDQIFKEKENAFLIAFFPFYPILVRGFFFIVKNYELSSLIVSNISYIFSVFYLYKLVRLDFKQKSALLSIIYFSVFPTAYFLHAGYTEGLFLALTIASFYYARNSKWMLAGVLGMLALFTRITGIILFPSLIIEYFNQKKFKFKNIRKEILWLAIIPLGLVAYMYINFETFGSPFQFLNVQREHWGMNILTPAEGAIDSSNVIRDHPPYFKMANGFMQYFFVFTGLILVVYSFLRMRLSYGVYSLITWWIITATGRWISVPRFTLVIFPIFIALSIFSDREEIHFATIFTSIMLYALFLAHFVKGNWAF